MTINIKFDIIKDNYILTIKNRQIKISFEEKSMNSKDLYEYIFSDLKEKLELNYINVIEDTLNSEEEWIKNLTKEETLKIKSEGNFISNKIENLLNSILIKVNKIIADHDNELTLTE